MNINLDILLKESFSDYEAKKASYLTSHQLIDFIRCPLLYHKKAMGLIKDADTTAWLIGRAAHLRILEGQQAFEAAFAFGGPINESIGKPYGKTTKVFAEWAAKQNKPVLSYDQMELVERMMSGVAANEAATKLLDHGIAEGVIRGEICDVPCQARMDWVNPDVGLVELKTCDDLTYFEGDIRRYNYHLQVGFYYILLEQKEQTCPVYIVGIEKKEPFRCGIWLITQETMRIAKNEIQAAIKRLIECRQSDHWPTGFEEIRMFNIS